MSQVLTSVAGEALLEGFADPELLTRGLVSAISVEAVRERDVDRWPARRAQVWDFAARHFNKEFSPADQILRLDDCTYLLVQPDETPQRAKGRAISFLRAVLVYFLGSSLIADFRIGLVTAVGPAGIEQSPLPVGEISAALAAADAAGAASRAAPLPVPANTDQPCDVVLLSQPIWAVQKRAVASYRLRPLGLSGGDPPEGPAEGGGVSTRAVIDFDLKVLDQALEILGQWSERRFGLHVPLQIRTLNSIPGRQAVLAHIRAARAPTRESLVICLQGLDAGVPRMVLETAASALKTVCLGVVGRAPSLATDVTAWRGSRLSAVSFDFNDLPPGGDADLAPALARFAGAASTVGPTLFGHSLTTRARVLAAWAAGFTHLSGDILEDRSAAPYTPMRFEATDLYAEL